jgi:hypothetical protein
MSKGRVGAAHAHRDAFGLFVSGGGGYSKGNALASVEHTRNGQERDLQN